MSAPITSARASASSVPGEKPIPRFIRRSVLSLSAEDTKLSETASTANADAVMLTFNRSHETDWQADLRGRLPAAIHAARQGGAEVFVRIDAAAAAAELDAAVFAGLSGIVLTGATGQEDVLATDVRLAELEAARGIPAGTLEIDVDVDNAAAVWHALEIARASRRFGLFIVNETALLRHLGAQTTAILDFDPLEFVKSQLITVAASVGGQAVGMAYPLSLSETNVQPGTDEDAVKRAIRRARDTGFKGAICPHVSWIRLCNDGFRPTAEEAAYYRKVIDVFADGLRRGMASVPLDGKMIDVPVDVRAKLYLKWFQRAQARDDEKARAQGNEVASR